ncbi:MAG: protein-L-isoaspartate(D-aspartate) O-methyltransferase [Moritella sp.]|uniref:protein-L-isoaspartate(D-aspartate) O-methyltransferase n=1 Tax=Moritella sp. TaxID=78556 RepID=UPI0025DAD16F|nr:protein-L-isoaspartate(D-aspartate) O-methyltransferase [Moritella sp.]NQZ93000.1 protein-L-isoaspartate(D-aspartate) O-methyltransferase [Moritella sp.]
MIQLGNTGVAGQRIKALLEQQGISASSVLTAIQDTPRDYFVEEAFALQAWGNQALPIGAGQTISQPYIVARMTELLMQNNPQRVLEIGTGSGYQTAILAQVFPRVYSVERIQVLQWQAKRRLKNLDLHNVMMKYGDGWQGWSSKGPFDAIIVTAAPAAVPQALLTQLTDGGQLILPLGVESQVLQVITRNGDNYTSQNVENVRFVPLVQGELA